MLFRKRTSIILVMVEMFVCVCVYVTRGEELRLYAHHTFVTFSLILNYKNYILKKKMRKT